MAELRLLTITLRPDVTFFCDLNFDPFLFMQDNEKVYGTFRGTVIFPFRALSAPQVSLSAFPSMAKQLKRCGRP